MRTREEIEKRLAALAADARLKAPPALVQVNAPLALIQVDGHAEERALRWVLGGEQHDGDG